MYVFPDRVPMTIHSLLACFFFFQVLRSWMRDAVAWGETMARSHVYHNRCHAGTGIDTSSGMHITWLKLQVWLQSRGYSTETPPSSSLTPWQFASLQSYEPCLQFVKTEPGIEKSQTVDVKIPFSCSSFEIVVSRSSNKDRNIPIPLCFRARGPFRSMNKSFLKESNAFGNRLFADIWRLIVVVPLVNENNLAGPKTDLCL